MTVRSFYKRTDSPLDCKAQYGLLRLTEYSRNERKTE